MANVALESGVQECIESLQDLKANNAEESYLKGLDKKLIMWKSDISLQNLELLFVVSSTLILKFGIATAVALVGSILLIDGEIDIPLFLCFLLCCFKVVCTA